MWRHKRRTIVLHIFLYFVYITRYGLCQSSIDSQSMETQKILSSPLNIQWWVCVNYSIICKHLPECEETNSQLFLQFLGEGPERKWAGRKQEKKRGKCTKLHTTSILPKQKWRKERATEEGMETGCNVCRKFKPHVPSIPNPPSPHAHACIPYPQPPPPPQLILQTCASIHLLVCLCICSSLQSVAVSCGWPGFRWVHWVWSSKQHLWCCWPVNAICTNKELSTRE